MPISLKKLKTILFFFMCFHVSASWAVIQLRPNAPMQYIVQPGDTVWGIACRFLQNPGQWSELFSTNPHIAHAPDKLYVGDILILKEDKGHAQLKRVGRNTLKLSPTMRIEPLDNPIPTIPYVELKPFLQGLLIADPAWLEHQPYVLSIQGDDASGMMDDEIYAKNLDNPRYQSYYLYRKEKPLFDTPGKLFLGYQMNEIGEAHVLRYRANSPATLLVTRSLKEIQPGDYIIAKPPLHPVETFSIREPKTHIVGQIISQLNEDGEVTQYQIVILNRGITDGVRLGDVLAVYRQNLSVPDPHDPECKRSHKKHWVKLPNHRIGEVLVFKLFDHASLGLITISQEEAKKWDVVTNP